MGWLENVVDLLALVVVCFALYGAWCKGREDTGFRGDPGRQRDVSCGAQDVACELRGLNDRVARVEGALAAERGARARVDDSADPYG